MLTEEKYSNEYDLDGIRSKKVSVVTKYNINSGSGGGTVMSGGNSVQAVVKPPINQPEKKLISKTTKTHTYLTQNGKVMRDTLNTTVLQTKITRKTEILDFVYDESGRPFALIYTNGAADPVTYYYVLNLQGDVVALTDDTGAIVAEYVYNAWGKTLHILNSDGNEITSSSNIAIINPLRYRGYYYDTETGWYYLQSRYYDPANHRFINADTYASTDSTDAISCNMFAYCSNNPVLLEDQNGEIGVVAVSLILAVVCAVVDYGVQVGSNYQEGYTGKQAWVDNVSFGSVVSSAFSGGIALSTYGVGSAMAEFLLSPAIELSVDHAISPEKNKPLNLENYTIKQAERFGDVCITGEIGNAIPRSYQNPLTKNAIQSTTKGMIRSKAVNSIWSAIKKLIMAIF